MARAHGLDGDDRALREACGQQRADFFDAFALRGLERDEARQLFRGRVEPVDQLAQPV